VALRLLTRVQYVGRPGPEALRGGLLIASNHQSFLDPPLIGVACRRRICYLARASLFEKRILGRLIRGLRTHPVARGAADTRALRAVTRLLRSSEVVLMFPEGTRSPDGELGPFKLGVAALAIRCAVPVLPVCVEGAFDCWPRTRALPRPGRVLVAFGQPIRDPGRDARALNRRLREEVSRLQTFLRERMSSMRSTDSKRCAPLRGAVSGRPQVAERTR
jgi:1-acyl-sn-glycerol-3-phosphate acyltransferase